MSQTSQPFRVLRSIGAVLAGMLAIVVLSLATDEVLHATGLLPRLNMTDAHAVLALSYRLVYGIAGGYLTARLAASRPMLHAVVLGGIGTALSILGAAATWNAGPALGPQWYPLSLVVTALPCAWAGGKLFDLLAAKRGA